MVRQLLSCGIAPGAGGEVEDRLREGQERRAFASHPEELVGFLPVGNVSHKV